MNSIEWWRKCVGVCLCAAVCTCEWMFGPILIIFMMKHDRKKWKSVCVCVDLVIVCKTKCIPLIRGKKTRIFHFSLLWHNPSQWRGDTVNKTDNNHNKKNDEHRSPANGDGKMITITLSTEKFTARVVGAPRVSGVLMLGWCWFAARTIPFCIAHWAEVLNKEAIYLSYVLLLQMIYT